MFLFITLDPRPERNQAMRDMLAANPTLGIEVTIPELAESCTDNIDPQHGKYGNQDFAAIDLSLTYPLPDVGQIATIRLDLDSVGAMAVLALRSEGRFSALLHDRIMRISEHDRFVSGPWKAKALDTTTIDWELRALSSLIMEFKVDITRRVDLMCRWLTGEPTAEVNRRMPVVEEECRVAVEDSSVEDDNGLALVVSTHRFALELGYSVAPVVFAANPEFYNGSGPVHTKYTIAQWPGEDRLDMQGLLQELRYREAGWGGNAAGGVIGSPQGVSSAFDYLELVGFIHEFMR